MQQIHKRDLEPDLTPEINDFNRQIPKPRRLSQITL